MLEQMKNWLRRRFSAEESSADTTLRESGMRPSPRTAEKPAAAKQAHPRRQPEYVELDPALSGKVEDNGPGKNVLIRNKYVREETGTHESLTILDDSIVDSGEETGIDPYNTGGFDRSRNWDKRFRN